MLRREHTLAGHSHMHAAEFYTRTPGCASTLKILCRDLVSMCCRMIIIKDSRDSDEGPDNNIVANIDW